MGPLIHPPSGGGRRKIDQRMSHKNPGSGKGGLGAGIFHHGAEIREFFQLYRVSDLNNGLFVAEALRVREGHPNVG
jgi:hypothetical protein